MAIKQFLKSFNQQNDIFEQIIIVRQALSGMRLSRWQLTKLVLGQIWRDMTPTARVLTFLITILTATFICDRYLRPKSLARRLDIPALRERKTSLVEKLDLAVTKYTDSPFIIEAFGTEYVVFPSRFFGEIKRLADTQASALEFFRGAYWSKWSGFPQHTVELMKTISIDLTRAIPSLVQWRQKDCAAACDAVIGSPDTWKEINLFTSTQTIVVSTNSSAFVGRQLGNSKFWIRLIESLPLAVALPTVVLAYTPVLLRPLLLPLVFTPTNFAWLCIRRSLMPILEADLAQLDMGGQHEVTREKMPLTAWLTNRYRASKNPVIVSMAMNKRRLLDQLVIDYANVSFESTPSTAGTLFYVVGELAADPSLADELREEIKTLAPDGKLPLTHLHELRKMDSVMRESARVHPFNDLTLFRKLLGPIQLSAGPLLPEGTNICVDARNINFNEELWPDAHKFDGLRHYRARQRDGSDQKFKFPNLGADAPGWGDGLQACPGRLFADNTLKIILTHLLLHYEFKLRPGDVKPKRGSMPNGSMFPEMKARILIRARRRVPRGENVYF